MRRGAESFATGRVSRRIPLLPLSGCILCLGRHVGVSDVILPFATLLRANNGVLPVGVGRRVVDRVARVLVRHDMLRVRVRGIKVLLIGRVRLRERLVRKRRRRGRRRAEGHVRLHLSCPERLLEARVNLRLVLGGYDKRLVLPILILSHRRGERGGRCGSAAGRRAPVGVFAAHELGRRRQCR